MVKEHPTFSHMHIRFEIIPGRTLPDVIIPTLAHRDRIVEITTGQVNVNECDALMTSNPAFLLGVTTADCGAVCFADEQKIAVAHIGWRGLCLGLIERVLAMFDPVTTEIFVGPRLDTFEIQKDFCHDVITEKFGKQFLTEHDGIITFHFRDAIASCLPEQADFDPRDTGTDITLPSYRRDKTSDRLVTVVGFNK